MKRAVLALIAIWLWCFSIALAADRPMTRQIVFDGLERSYVVYAPASVSGRRAALVVVLHGQGGDGENALEQGGWVAKARAEGFIVLAPEGTPERADRRPSLLGNRRSWNSGPATGSSAQQRNVDDVGFVRAVIGEVQRTYSVDAGRIYATGFSNGSAMA